jgi:hypothetical protein
MKKLATLLVLGLLVYGILAYYPDLPVEHFLAQDTPSAELLHTLYANRQSDVQVEGSGIVKAILPDDTQGSRHQKFILELANGQTLLISHNIDLAPRIDTLRPGDRVSFYGEYEWNPKGGIIHWTHHDPQGLHADGWLLHDGKRYQ